MFDKIKLNPMYIKSKNNNVAKIAICFLIALSATGLLLVSNMYINRTVPVIKPSHTINQGKIITERDIEVVKIPKLGIPLNAIVNKADIIGKCAKSDIYKSDFFLPEKLTFMGVELNKNERLMSFSTNTLASSVADNIKAGNHIKIYYAIESRDEFSPASQSAIIVAPDCLNSLKVYDIKDKSGFDEYQDEDKDKPTINASETSFIPAVITVIVNDEQALELYKAEISKNIHVVLMEGTKDGN